jgi:hypothetical protein
MLTFILCVELISYQLQYHWCLPGKFSKNLATNMAAQAVVFQDCRANGVNLKQNLIQTS